MPKLPNVEMARKPIEEQPAQILVAMPRAEPENKDLSNFSLEFLITYMFIATNIPINAEVMFARMNPPTASSGR